MEVEILLSVEKREKTVNLPSVSAKAYQNSVNKSHVTDIRDTLDYYEATGFLLAVTSDITAPLIDHLTSLEKKYDVDWWTRRELFKIMRQYPSLVNAYQDIIKVVDNKEGQS
ncbi:MAG: restriction endonuclease [Oscillospiraceae bacterium]